MSEYLNVNVTFHMEVESETHALALRNKILNIIADQDLVQEGLYEITCTEPYSAYDEGSEPQPEKPVNELGVLHT